MQQTLIHYGPFKRTSSIDELVRDQLKILSEHFSPQGHQVFQVWLDRHRTRRSPNNMSYHCKIKVQTDNGKNIFVEKNDQNLFGALNRARRAALNLLDHSREIGRKKRKVAARQQRELIQTNNFSNRLQPDSYSVEL